MDHVRGAPNHPQTQSKIERWHQTRKNRVLLENYYLPGALKQAVEAFRRLDPRLRQSITFDNDTAFARAVSVRSASCLRAKREARVHGTGLVVGSYWR